MNIKIKKEQILGTAKVVVGISAAIGVGVLAGSALKMIPLPTQSLLGKACVGVGVFVVQSMAGDMAMEYVGEKVDEIGMLWDEVETSIRAANLHNEIKNIKEDE